MKEFLSNPTVAFTIGLFIGGNVGLVMACLLMRTKADERFEKYKLNFHKEQHKFLTQMMEEKNERKRNLQKPDAESDRETRK